MRAASPASVALSPSPMSDAACAADQAHSSRHLCIFERVCCSPIRFAVRFISSPCISLPSGHAGCDGIGQSGGRHAQSAACSLNGQTRQLYTCASKMISTTDHARKPSCFRYFRLWRNFSLVVSGLLVRLRVLLIITGDFVVLPIIFWDHVSFAKAELAPNSCGLTSITNIFLIHHVSLRFRDGQLWSRECVQLDNLNGLSLLVLSGFFVCLQ